MYSRGARLAAVLAILAVAAPAVSAFAQSSTALNNAIKKYNDSAYDEAAFGFYEVAAFDPVLENRLKAEYYLAQSLRKMKLERSAAFYYQAVMSQGPNHPYYLKSIEELIEVTEAIGDDLFLPIAINREYNAEFAKLPPATLYKINYLIGLTAFRQDRAQDALSFLQAVPRESSYHAKALYLAGIIRTFQGRQGGQQALKDYQDILALKDTADLKYWELDNTKQLAILALARTQYSLGEYAEAKQWFEKVERYTTYWDVGLFEYGWASFLAGDIGSALGSLHSLHAPQLAGSFQPEALILKATVYYSACLYDEVKKELETFGSRYKPMRDQVDKIVSARTEDSDLPSYLTLVTEPGAQADALPVPVRNLLLDNQRIQSLIGYIQILEKEEAGVTGTSVWRGSSLQKELLAQLSGQREQNILATGRFIRSRLERLVRDVDQFDGQGDLLRFETSKAEKVMLETGVDPATRLTGQELLRPKMPGERWEYWSFDGEWWVDELGFYKYTLKSACEAGQQGAGGGLRN